MLPPNDDCDDCKPDYLKHTSSVHILSALPFLLTFLLVAFVVLRKLYPLLSGCRGGERHQDLEPPAQNYGINSASSITRNRSLRTWFAKLDARRIAPLVFATNIGLSTVVVELILCEISNTLNASARQLALDLTLPTLMFSLIVITPALELRAILASAGLAYGGIGKTRLRVAWFIEGLALALWLFAFWYIGHALLALYLREKTLLPGKSRNFSEGCLERIGVIGISLMACLSGFAAVSALWQTFGVKDRLVSDADILRKQAGLDATMDMLGAKKSRLRAVERKLSDTRDEGFMTRVIGTLRGSSDTQERTNLELEVSGLESMRISLDQTLYALRNRRNSQLRAHTPLGRLLVTFSYGFAIYCAYRLVNTTLNILRRSLFSSVSSASTDPVTNLLALVAKHWDPTLNQAMWSRQISFLLSGVMLLLAFNSALQTFLLLARAFPSLLSATFGGANFALLVSQVCASYVISSALLLRSNLPSEVGGVISDALGAPLETGKVDAWFEAWFMGACLFTGVGIWVGRKLRGPGEWDEDNDADLELGKMS